MKRDSRTHRIDMQLITEHPDNPILEKEGYTMPSGDDYEVLTGTSPLYGQSTEQ